MKEGIHPEYSDAVFKCSCGNEIVTCSTKSGDRTTEICSACHPFFTGKQKLIDTRGAFPSQVRPEQQVVFRDGLCGRLFVSGGARCETLAPLKRFF